MAGLTELPREMQHFAQYLNAAVVPAVDRDGTWFREFRRHDEEGMRACLEGREVPPWDVVASLLEDLAAVHGPDAARREHVRARLLYDASVRAHDRAPGAHPLLTERLRLLRWEQQQAAQRLRQIHEFQAASADPAERRAVESELAWAQDYYARISSRITELRRRVAELEQRAATLSDRASARPWDPWVAPPARATTETPPAQQHAATPAAPT
ncbi:hypothetical protein ACFP3V_31505, partial [Streptacidiphilus monticola]